MKAKPGWCDIFSQGIYQDGLMDPNDIAFAPKSKEINQDVVVSIKLLKVFDQMRVGDILNNISKSLTVVRAQSDIAENRL